MATSDMEEQQPPQNGHHPAANGLPNGKPTILKSTKRTDSQSSQSSPNGSPRSSSKTVHFQTVTYTTSTLSSSSSSYSSSSSSLSSFSAYSDASASTSTAKLTTASSSSASLSAAAWATLESLVHGTVLALIVFHILVAPFTKVEESFNLQATHDILTFGVSSEGVKQYDHLEFPGVVPRTFVGPLLLAAGSWPIMAVARLVAPGSELPKGLLGQIIVRTVLGLMTFSAWQQMSRGIRHQFGRTVSLLFMVVSGVQFHWLFYAGRTLPNTFALAIVNVAYSYWMQASSQPSRFVTEQKLMRMIDALVLGTILFRSELLILLGPIVLLELIMTRIRFWRTVQEGLLAGVLSIGLAIAVDSWFWRQWMWAEGAVFWYNAVLGKSVAWGVSPWHTYFTQLLPKISGLALPLALAAVVVEQRFRRYMLPAGVFVGLYSFLGHKEWRFVIYVVPILNLGAAIMISWIVKRKTLAYRMITLVVFGVLGLSFFSSLMQSMISSRNYPGGVALQRLHELELDHFAAATVHIDGAAAESGCSRFGEVGSSLDLSSFSEYPYYPWTYSKDESHRSPRDYLHYTHLLTSKPEFHRHDFEVLERIDGYAGLRRVPLAGIKSTCPAVMKEIFATVDEEEERTSSAPDFIAGMRGKAEKVWARCSPVQINTEGRIWIMKRIGAV
ncbi:dolichyl-P-Man:Man(7)GlcNAc(2)-PP-dolichol alpha-1,6-mannosyltransferase [Mortierella alpina]|nr:dolichyl-P-Man:Man(7)GlcNAc(2)-PP-dolichol alpha-1,6-mannosyltransferase [Mortierella alpina]